MPDTPFHEWTPCEVHGHRWPDDPEDGTSCTDCGEPRDEED